MSLATLRTLLARHARPDYTTVIEDVLISKVEQRTRPAPEMSGVIFALVAQGGKRIAMGDRLYEYRAGQCLIASVDVPIIGEYTEASSQRPALGIGLLLQPAAITELLLQADPRRLRHASGGPPPSLAVSDAPEELVDAVIRLVRLLERPGDIPVLAPMIKREILWRLLTGEQGVIIRQLGLADSGLSHIARAVRWIRENYARPFRVEDLAHMSGMSTSAFYRNFQLVTAISPIQFQKQIRLQQARLMLAAKPSDISGVASRVGYDSASQFSREYRRQFGVPPSQDALRLKDLSDGQDLLAAR